MTAKWAENLLLEQSCSHAAAKPRHSQKIERKDTISVRIQTSSYFQPTTNHSALLLQHYQINNVPLCFACICPAEDPVRGRAAGYFTEQLLHWFRALSWRKLSRDPEKHLLHTETKLRRAIERTIEELTSSNLLSARERFSFAAIFCIDEHFLLFCQGSTEIYLLNRNLGRGSLQCISDNLSPPADEHADFLHGLLQPDIGLLLATDTFCNNTDRQELRDCLYVKDIQTEDRARRHLLELGRHIEARGGCHMGAILIQTMTDEEK